MGRLHRPADGGTDRHLQFGDQQVSRADQDAFAARSHQRAHAAVRRGDGRGDCRGRVPQRRGEDRGGAVDEGIREGVTAESLSSLRPAFGKDGTITAASASPISDGAAALVVTSHEPRNGSGLPAGRDRAHGMVAGPDSSLQLQPSNAILQACTKQGIDVADLDLIEINEAFAAVGVASARALGLSAAQTDERVNVNGGASRWTSHRRVRRPADPAPGVRLRRRGGGTGVAALCGGGGQGDALIISAAGRPAERSAANRP